MNVPREWEQFLNEALELPEVLKGLELYEKLSKLAEAKDQGIDEYCKEVLKDHVKSL